MSSQGSLQRGFPVKKEYSASPGVLPQSAGSGTNEKLDKEWQEFPLKCYTEEDIKDKRYHIARFTNKNKVDIVQDFTKPVRLHRKDPRNIQFHLSRREIDIKKKQDKIKAAEKEKRRQQRLAGIPVEVDSESENEEKSGTGSPNTSDSNNVKDGEMDLSQVAPEGGARNFRRNMFKRKTRQINLMADEKRKLRYEEYYPWVMEDYDGKNVYVGNYEAGASEATHVLLVTDGTGFKMLPAEKVYRFNPRNKYATLTLEEAEAKMEKKSAVPRWLMKHMSENEPEKDYRFRNATPGSREINTPNRTNVKRERLRTVSGASSFNERDSDHDDIDFEEEFADDEEAPIMDGDEEENKLSEMKIKKEMLKAAHFDGGSDADGDDDLDDLFETEKSRKIDKEGKKLRKVLNKTEGGVYDSDDDDEQLNPYLSRSDLESDESDDDILVKQEKDNDGTLDSQLNKPTIRQFFANNVGDGFVVIKAPTQFLNGFPKGDWLPNGRKRALSDIAESPQKKHKSGISREATASPSPVSGDGNTTPQNFDLEDSGPDGTLVTISEVLNIVKGNPITTKELLLNLRGRINSRKENKQRVILIVKKYLKLEDGKLVLRE